MTLKNKLVQLVIILVFVLFIGTAGYTILEGWSVFDSLYMTVITITSVGYSEIHPLSMHGRIFTVFLIIGGMGVLLYSLSIFTAFFVEGELKDILRRKKMEKKIAHFKNHYIVCGYGKTGVVIVDELIRTKRNFVVIEKNQENTKILKHLNIPVIEGDATDDNTLVKANIKYAKGLVSVLTDDKDNLFVVLSAKALNPNVRVVSRVIEEEAELKIRKAGADSIVSPNAIGGLRLISELVRPAAVSFLDIMLHQKGDTLRIEDIEVRKNSNICGKSIEESDILKKTKLIIVAVKKGNSFEFNPSHKTAIDKGDYLIVMGHIEQINKLRNLAGSVA